MSGIFSSKQCLWILIFYYLIEFIFVNSLAWHLFFWLGLSPFLLCLWACPCYGFVMQLYCYYRDMTNSYHGNDHNVSWMIRYGTALMCVHNKSLIWESSGDNSSLSRRRKKGGWCALKNLILQRHWFTVLSHTAVWQAVVWLAEKMYSTAIFYQDKRNRYNCH